MRRHRLSKYYEQKIIDGHAVFIPKTDDLDDEELQFHLNWALDGEDFEYASAISAEAQMRNINLTYSEL